MAKRSKVYILSNTLTKEVSKLQICDGTIKSAVSFTAKSADFAKEDIIDS